MSEHIYPQAHARVPPGHDERVRQIRDALDPGLSVAAYDAYVAICGIAGQMPITRGALNGRCRDRVERVSRALWLALKEVEP